MALLWFVRVALAFFVFLLVVALVHGRWWQVGVGFIGATNSLILLRNLARTPPRST